MKPKDLLTEQMVADNEYNKFEIKENPCPCGKGYIDEFIDRTPGFREHSIRIICDKCNEDYYIDTTNGRSSWTIKKK